MKHVMGGWRPTQQPEQSEKLDLVQFVEDEFGGFGKPEIARSLFELGRLHDEGVELTPALVRSIVTRGRAAFYAEAEHQMQRRTKPSVVYYMRLGNRVKIGITTNLALRVKSINPEEVMVTEEGGIKLERLRHRQFAALRVSGEWFRLEGPLAEHIEALQRRAEDHAA